MPPTYNTITCRQCGKYSKHHRHAAVSVLAASAKRHYCASVRDEPFLGNSASEILADLWMIREINQWCLSLPLPKHSWPPILPSCKPAPGCT